MDLSWKEVYECYDDTLDSFSLPFQKWNEKNRHHQLTFGSYAKQRKSSMFQERREQLLH